MMTGLIVGVRHHHDTLTGGVGFQTLIRLVFYMFMSIFDSVAPHKEFTKHRLIFSTFFYQNKPV
jgi:hypothetical protein